MRHEGGEALERVTAALAEAINGDPRWMGDISLLAEVAVRALRPGDTITFEGDPTVWRVIDTTTHPQEAR